jgi:hypothetical protein
LHGSEWSGHFLLTAAEHTHHAPHMFQLQPASAPPMAHNRTPHKKPHMPAAARESRARNTTHLGRRQGLRVMPSSSSAAPCSEVWVHDALEDQTRHGVSWQSAVLTKGATAAGWDNEKHNQCPWYFFPRDVLPKQFASIARDASMSPFVRAIQIAIELCSSLDERRHGLE